MPIIKSAKKRARVAKKATIRNRQTKRLVKDATKAFQSALSGGGKKATEAQSKAQSELDKAAKKGVIHKNKAARKKRQLAKATQASKTSKPTAKTTKPAAKKTTKTATKKTAAKKSA